MDDGQLDSLLTSAGDSLTDAPDGLVDSVMQKVISNEHLAETWLIRTVTAGFVALVTAAAIGFGTARLLEPQPPELTLFSPRAMLFQTAP